MEKIRRRGIIEKIYKEIEASKGTHIWNDYINALKLISQVVFTRSSGFVFELIQNAEDSGLELENKGIFEIILNEERMKVIHNGRPFDEIDVRSLCGIRSSKKPEKGTLGYLGIGFKSVFKVTDCPEIYSDGFQFKFDRNYWDDASNTPWHVLPIFVDEPSETIDMEKTTFIIPFRDTNYYSILNDELIKIKTELYLFLRWLKIIEITDEVSGIKSTIENKGEDDKGISILRHDNEIQEFKFFRRIIQVPELVKLDRLTQEYRANVTQREIAIAFAIDDEGNLAPSEAGAMYGGVYSFLPLGESRSGAKFPIQADFLVQPGRDAINYEAKWNHWLLEEVATLCKEAICYFKEHEKWKYQFLPAFEFSRKEDLESYYKLFGPKLIEPIDNFIEQDNCVPTTDGGWGEPNKVVWITEKPEAINDLVPMGIIYENEIASVMGGQAGLKIVHPSLIDRKLKPIRKVDRWDILKNYEFLREKSQCLDGSLWFRSFYQWLQKHPVYEDYFYYTWKKRLKTYHDYEFILTNEGELLKGGEVYLLDITSSDPFIKELTDELQGLKHILHSSILLEDQEEEERKNLRGFLTGITGVQVLDTKKVCKETLLPKIKTSAPKPMPKDLLRYTIYCQKIIGEDIGRDIELWVLTKDGEVRSAKEVCFSKEFRPEKDWESLQQYVPGIRFISEQYLEGVTSNDELSDWQEFFKSGGIKDDPDNGVEEFAMNCAEKKLKLSCRTVVRVDKRNFGYDLEAETLHGVKMHIEVKGQSSENDVELSSNETEAADLYKDNYYLCVVSSIPNNPLIYMVQNPAAPGIGKKDKLTIPIKIWKQSKFQ